MIYSFTFIWAFYLKVSIASVYQCNFIASKTLSYSAFSDKRVAVSGLHCADICSRDHKCWGFRFDRTNRTCHTRHAVRENAIETDFMSYAKIGDTPVIVQLLSGSSVIFTLGTVLVLKVWHSTGPLDFSANESTVNAYDSLLGKTACPEDYTWIVELDFCYKVCVEVPRSWKDAQTTCKEDTDGGKLAILDSPRKHREVVKSAELFRRARSFLVGANRTHVSDDFRWLDNQLVNETRVCPNEARKYKCGILWKFNDYCMRGIRCGTKFEFVCEKPLD